MGSTNSEGQLHGAVFATAPDPIFVHDPETGRVTTANPAAGGLLGVDPDAIEGMHVGEFSPPDYSTADANDLIRRAHETGQSHVEWRVEGPDGETRWTDVELRSATFGGNDRVVAYAKDVTEYRAAERKHRTERNLLDRLLDVSPVGIVIHDAEGRIQRTNEQAESILGVDRSELVGDGVAPEQLQLRTVDGEELSAEDTPAAQVRRTGEAIQDVELAIRRNDDERVVVAVSAMPLYDDGDLDRIVVSLTDITERRQRELRRKERNEQLRALVDNLPVVVFTLDPDGVFTHSAGRGLATLGLEPGELEGVSIYDAYAEHDDIVDAAETALNGTEVRATQEIGDLTFETWYQPVYDESGDLTNVVGVARDISELKRRQERVEQLNEATTDLLYAETPGEVADSITDIAEDIVDHLMVALWTYDEEADRLSPESASEPAEAFVTERGSGFGPIDHGTDEMAIYERGETAYIEDYSELEAPSHPDIPLRSVLCLPLGEYGILFVGSPEVMAFDDTERHLLEILASTATAALERAERSRELREHREELERSNESLQQFAYVASHDLQEPLRMVSSFIDLLDTEYGDQFDEQAREYMDFAVDGANRMQDMIDGLLAYSRVQTAAEEFEETDTEAVVEETISALRMHVDDADAEVTVGPLPDVEADPNQFGQVFQNLLKNAVTYAAEGDREPRVQIEAETDGEMATFRVSDNGPGIPESVQEDIFDVFTRGGAHDTEGTGIGLPICERIVHRHGGEIWVESTPGEGATFAFTVPAVTTEDESHV